VCFNIPDLINLLQLNILCTSAVKLDYTKNNNSLFMCFQIPDFIEKENFPSGSLDLYLFFSHCGSFAAKTV